MADPKAELSLNSAGHANRSGWLNAIGLGRPELRAWAMYDWANSAMVTTIIAAVFPIYFGQVACQGYKGSSTALFAGVTTIGMIISAIMSPLLGALADTRPIKKPLLAAFMAVGLVSVAGMFFVKEGNYVLASVLFMLANIGANGSFVFYDALLPHVAHPDEVDRVSTAGYALGYLGGGLLLALNLAWIMKPGWFGLPKGTLPSRLAFVSVAVWWGLFSIPLFLRVSEPPVSLNSHRSSGGLGSQVMAQLAGTCRELSRFRAGLIMLVAFLIYNDGIGTVIRMATKYGEEIGIEEGTMIGSLVLTQFVGIPFAFLFGILSRKIAARQLILFCLVAYLGISVLGYYMTSNTHFVFLAILVAMVQGGAQALSRSLFSSLIPRQRSGEFFGFFAVVEKFAGIIGPLIFGLTIAATGSTRLSILTVIPFFVIGGLVLMLVDVPGGRAAARAEEQELALKAGNSPEA